MTVTGATALLAPDAGLVRRWWLEPPAGSDRPLWALVADLNGSERVRQRRPDEMSLDLVGAYGVNRATTVVRGIGEAVERAALLPPATPHRVGAADPRFFDGPGFADPLARHRQWPVIDGWDLLSHHSVSVPAAVVDHPVGDEPALDCFDPTPSGTAAGTDPDRALAAALREVVERDAVQVAWSAQLALGRIEPSLVAAAPGGARLVGELQSLLAICDEAGIEVVTAVAPTCHPEVACYVCAGFDRAGVGAVGAKVASDPVTGLVGGLQEVLQVRGLLHRIAAGASPLADGATVADDVQRARYWTGPSAVSRLRRWCATFRPLAAPPPLAPEPSAAELVGALAADGARPVAVDLTDRLPPAIRAAGWSVVKVVALGYQPLRMDERHPFTWVPDRLNTAQERTGCPSAVGDASRETAGPHPLI
jgi:ribosomal protein S12 methylthiotransferase accessory factor